MSCPINSPKDFFQGVLAELNSIKRNSEKFNLNDFIKNIYDKVQEEVKNNPDQAGVAVGVVKSLPTAIMASFADFPLYMYLDQNGLDVLELTRVNATLSNIIPAEGETEAEALEKTVANLLGKGGRQAEMVKDIKENILFKNTQLENPNVSRLKQASADFQAKAYNIFTTTMVTYQLEDSNGNLVSQKEAREKNIETQKVERPETKYYADFIRHIGKAVYQSIATDGKVMLPGTSIPIYLTARQLNSIPSEQRYESFTSKMMQDIYDMVQVITDRAGNPIYFDNNFNVTSKDAGKMIYYRFRKEESGIQNINDAAKTHLKAYIFKREAQGQEVTDQDLAVEESLFRKRYTAQIKYKNDIVNYIKKSPENFITSEITAFSNGFIDKKFFKVIPLRSINLTGETYRIDLVEAREQYQKSYAVLKVGANDPVGLYSYGVPDNYVNLIADFLTEDVYDGSDPQKKVMSNYNKSVIVDQYVFKNSSDFAITKIGEDQFKVSLGTLSDQQVDKATAKEMIKKYLTEKQVNPKTGKPQSKILNVSKKYINDPLAFKDFTLEPAEDGKFKTVPTNKSYTDFIFDNFSIEGLIDGNGRLRGENPYLEYSIKNIQETKDKLQPPKQAPSTPVIDLSSLPNFTSPQDVPTTGLDDIFNKIRNNKTLEKTLAQKTLNKDSFASDEELQEVLDLTQEWYTSTTLNKEFPLHVLFDVVNSNAVATWTKDAVTLYAGSDYTDLFHEAYHGFTQKFLTPQQRQALYDELRTEKTNDTYTTFKGQTKTFGESSSSNRELDEYLAEEYRNYMISNAKTEVGRRKADNIFKKIFNFIKKLFGRAGAKNTVFAAVTNYDTTVPLINEIFQKLALGNIHEFVPSDENMMDEYLEKNLVSNDKQESLTKTDSNHVNLAASSIISELADMLNASDNTSEYTTKLLISPQNRPLAYQYIQRAFSEKLGKIAQEYNVLVQNQPSEDASDYDQYLNKKAALEHKIYVLKFTLDNFGEPTEYKKTTGFVDFFEKNGYPLLHLKDVETDEDFDESTYIPEQQRGYELSGNENSMTELASKQTLALIESLHLPKIDKKSGFAAPILDTASGALKYEFEKDIFGFRKLVDFDIVWNRLSQILDGLEPSEDTFKAALVAESQNYPWIAQLLEKLGDPNTLNGWSSNVWANFVKDFNFKRIKLKALVIEEQATSDASVKNHSATFGVTSSSSKSAARDWEENFQLNRSNPYMNFDATGNKLNVEKVLADFQNNYIGREYQFFKVIGIDLINKPQVLRSILTSPTDKGMGRVEDWIRKLDNLKKGKFEIRSIRDIVIDRKAMVDGEKVNLPNLDTIYRKLQTLHLQYSDDRSDFMALRPDNNAQYEFSRNSSVTVQLQGLNDLRYKSYGDMINNPIYNHYDMRRNPFIEDLYIMNTLFDLKGDGSRRMDAFGYRTAQIDISNLAGTSFLTNGIGDGLANIDLDNYSKLLQDIHITMLNGVAEGPRAAGKPNTLLITNTGRDFYIAPEKFIAVGKDIQSTAPQLIVDQMIKYASAEMRRIKWLKDNPDSVEARTPVGKSSTYGKTGTEFVIFDKIFSDDTKKKLLDLNDTLGESKLKDVISKPEDDMEALRETMSVEIQNYFGRVSQDIINALVSVTKLYPEAELYLDQNLYNTVRERASKEGMTLMIPDANITSAIIQAYAYNSWVHNFELGILLYGDPAIYDHPKQDYTKRIAPFQSPGVFPIQSEPRYNYLNSVLGKPYLDSPWFTGTKPTHVKAFDGNANVVVFEEAIRRSVYLDTWTKAVTDDDLKVLRRTPSYLAADDATRTKMETALEASVKDMMDEAYAEMKEGDGQGWGAFDFYRALSDQLGAWSPAQESLYQKILKKENITQTKLDLQKIFPVLKLQYTGPLAGKNLPIVALLKFSIFPLIPNVIEGTVLEDLHNKLVEQNQDFATYQSGSKLGGLATPLWKNVAERTTFMDEPGYTFNSNTIFLAYFKKQAENADTFKKSTNLASQLRSIITNNFNEFGVPTDYMPTASPEERIAAWEAEEDKTKASDKFNAFNRYTNALVRLTNENIQKTYAKFGQTTKDGARQKNIQALTEYLKEQLAVLKIPSHVVENIAFDPKTGDIQTDLSLTFGADTIEKLLTSIINKTIVKPKVTGDQLVQVSNSMFMPKDYTALLNKYETDAERMEYLGSGDLPSYRVDQDGHILPQGVKIAMRKEFKPLLETTEVKEQAAKDGTTPLKALNKLIRTEGWMSGRNPDGSRNSDLITFISVRIPTAKENFIEYNQVYEFLEESAGPIFVGPMEMVGKSGTDYDNDKQVTYFPNITFNKSFNAEELKTYKQAYPDLNFNVKNLNRVIEQVEENGEDSLDADDSIIYRVAVRVQSEQVVLSSKGTKGSQNELLSSMKDLIRYNMSLGDFIRPVTTVTAKALADAAGKKLEASKAYNSKRKQDGSISKSISPTSLFEPLYNIEKLSEISIGMKALSVAAVGVKYNPIFNMANLALQTIYQTSGRLPFQKNVSMKFRHNVMILKGVPYISLASTYSFDSYRKVANELEELLNGWVDIEKDAWIFNLNGEKIVAPVMLTMIEGGVSKEDVSAFVNQPIVRDYVGRQALLGSPFAKVLKIAPEKSIYFKGKAREDMMKMLAMSKTQDGVTPDYTFYNWITPDMLKAIGITPLEEGESRYKYPFENNLESTINKFYEEYQKETGTNLTSDNLFNADVLDPKIGSKKPYDLEDIAVLLEYFKMEDLSTGPKDIKMNMNFDTTKQTTIFDMVQKDFKAKLLLKDPRYYKASVEKVFNDSVVSMFNVGEVAENLLGNNIFKIREGASVNDFIINNSSRFTAENEKTFDDMSTTIKEFKNGLVQFVLVNYINNIDIKKLKSFNSLVVKDNLSIEEAPGLRSFGAFVENGIMYINAAALEKNYINLQVEDTSHTKFGTALVTRNMFNYSKEYYNFVLTRELLRDITDVEQIVNSNEFKVAKKKAIESQSLANVINSIPIKVKNLVSNNNSEIDGVLLDIAKELGLSTKGYAKKTDTTTDIDTKYLDSQYGIKITQSDNASYAGALNVEQSDAVVIYGPTNSVYARNVISVAEKRNIPHIINPNALTLRKFLSENDVETLNVVGTPAELTNKNKEIYSDIFKAVLTPSSEARGAALLRQAYETVLRDMALDAVYNAYKIFKGTPEGGPSYAERVFNLKNEYPGIEEMYPLLSNSGLRIAVPKGSPAGIKTLKLATGRPSENLLERLREDYEALANPAANRFNIPYVEKEKIAKLMSMMPMVISISTGISAKGENALWQVVPDKSILPLKQKAFDAVNKSTSKQKIEIPTNVLDAYLSAFGQANSKANYLMRTRHKDLMVEGTFKTMGLKSNESQPSQESLAIINFQTDTLGNRVYDLIQIKSDQIAKIIKIQPNTVFLFNGSTNPDWTDANASNKAGILGKLLVDFPNVIPIRTFNMKYSSESAFTDENYAENVAMIDEDFAKLAEYIAKLSDQNIDASIVMPALGLGQTLIGASDFKKGLPNSLTAKGVKTFLYLSQKMQEFGLTNVNSDAETIIDQAGVSDASKITDAMVLDIINQRMCFKL